MPIKGQPIHSARPSAVVSQTSESPCSESQVFMNHSNLAERGDLSDTFFSEHRQPLFGAMKSAPLF